MNVLTPTLILFPLLTTWMLAFVFLKSKVQMSHVTWTGKSQHFLLNQLLFMTFTIHTWHYIYYLGNPKRISSHSTLNILCKFSLKVIQIFLISKTNLSIIMLCNLFLKWFYHLHYFSWPQPEIFLCVTTTWTTLSATQLIKFKQMT